MVSKWHLRAALMITTVVSLTGCMATRAESLPYVDLSQRPPLPATAAAQAVPVRVAVAAVVSPKGTAESYQPLLDYLSQKIDRSVELVQRRTYAEVNSLIEGGQVDMAFVCTSAYVIGRRDFGMQLLAAPRVAGKMVY